jgi:hypothetical protein
MVTTNTSAAVSGAAATIASDALMNPFDGSLFPHRLAMVRDANGLQ